jgi:hypothetical protein
LLKSEYETQENFEVKERQCTIRGGGEDESKSDIRDTYIIEVWRRGY